MPAKAARAAKTKALLSLRFIIRRSDDGFVAECIDAGAAGIGASRREAINELTESLEALYIDSGAAMKVSPVPSEEKLFRHLEKRGVPDRANADVVAWGRVEQVAAELPSGERAHSFDVYNLLVAA